ncbi:MAG: hypothetical protein LBF41_01440 [Deltaproteobacteria bacterium]|jgi:hypothetical protein|nr:hypothetical protein [Deltaproteobacteria bacterium]
MKKISICLSILFSFFLFVAVAAQAQIPPTALDGPPLTEADIPLFKAVMTNTMAAGADQAKLQSVYADTAKQNNTTEQHVMYVFTKISMIQSILAQPDAKAALTAGLPPAMVPSDAEIELISKNVASLY